MYFKSKKISLLILGITSILLSRAMFFFFNDPEGPNLLIVLVAAAIIYILSLMAYVSKRLTATGLRRLALAILIQILVVAAFYLLLK